MKRCIILIAFLFLEFPQFGHGFALLSHEAIIDSAWKSSIRPLLIHKYPSLTEDELKEAHSYLYGGSLMPDIGYYPFGSSLFSHLVHYVRSGDLVMAVLNEAQNMNEYAFGLGLLCHYNADKYGHSMGTNLAVPILFPKAKEKYGDTVTYEQYPSAHVRTEFGFDVLQTAKGNYASKEQHDFIGFHISQPVLERAFFKTYGLELKEIFKSLPVAVESFRFIVKQMFPELAKDAWKSRNSIITKLNPLAEKGKYTQKTDRRSYNKEYGKPKLKSGIYSFLLTLMPKIGPLSKLKFKEPTEKADKLFEESFNAILIHYSASLKKMETQKNQVENINFDTGKKTRLGEYKIADESYYKLLKKHKRKNFENIDIGLKENLIGFYSNPEIINVYKNKSRRLKKILKAIEELKKTS